MKIISKTEKRKKYLSALESKFQCGDTRYIEGMTDREFRDLICKYFLGENFIVPNPLAPMSDSKITSIAAYCIIKNN